MKKYLLVLRTLLLAATLSTPALATDENSNATIRLTGRPYIARGMTRETVREMVGAPSAQLAADVWVYFDVRSANAVATGKQNAAAAEAMDALVVTFTHDRVSLIRACDSKPVRAFIAQQEKSKNPAAFVAAK